LPAARCSLPNEPANARGEQLQYFLTYPKGEATVSYTDFKEAVWNKQIVRSSYRKGNTRRTREECFLEIARKRADLGRFFVTAEGSKHALQQLEHDEIIKFDANAGGYFITHDIYEEWALDKLIERTFGACTDYGKFYKKIGSSLAMRRSFRSWLSEKLSSNDSSAATLIEATIDNDCIERHWKDEVIIAALLSNHAKRFVDHFDRKFLEGLEKVVEPGRASATVTSVRVHYRYEKSLLYKVLFLLRLACKEADQDFLNLLGASHWDNDALRMLITKPKGSGWSSVIGFINAHKEELGIRYMRLILPVLDDWNRYHKRGETTKDASQIALFYFNELTKEDGHLPYGSRDDTKDQLVRTIFSGSAEIGEELKALFTEVIAKKNTGRRGRYYEIVKAALSALTESAEVAKNLPTEVIDLAILFWFSTPSKTSGLHSDYRNYPQYETDCQRVITETKEVVYGLQDDESDDKTFTLFYSGVPPCTCSVLIRDHFDQLDREGREFCKDVILKYASAWMQDGYAYQVGDGVEVAINVLPLLLKPFPEDRKRIKEILLLGLFDSQPMGMSQRFSDYAVGAIGKNLWREHAPDANSLFLGYLLLKPKLDVLREVMLKESHKKQIYRFSNTTVMRRFTVEHESEIGKIIENKVTYEPIAKRWRFEALGGVLRLAGRHFR
jgi:hypothetical protein